MKVRPNVVLAVVAGLVVALAVVAGLVTATREPPRLDPATPSGAVQLFVRAVLAGDDEAAVALMDPALGCTAPLREAYRPRRVSLAVVSDRTSGRTATVVLDITEYTGGPFDAASSHREVFDLLGGQSGWLVTGHPWPVYACK